MPLRIARYSDLDSITQIVAASFYDEELHAHIFPHRKQYPADHLRAWRQQISQWWWDYNRIWIVSYEQDEALGSQRLTGVAHWSRAGLGADSLWGVRWWDPSKSIQSLGHMLSLPFPLIQHVQSCINWPPNPICLSPGRSIVKVVTFFNSIQRILFPNRAQRKPTPEDPIPLTKWNFAPSILPFVSHFFSEPPYRRNHWDLEVLAVNPPDQKSGIGRTLVAWGLERAKADGLPAVVIGAKGTERFYQRCGFELLVGACPDVEFINVSGTPGHASSSGTDASKETRLRNPLRERNIGGGAIMWTKVKEDEMEEEERRRVEGTA